MKAKEMHIKNKDNLLIIEVDLEALEEDLEEVEVQTHFQVDAIIVMSLDIQNTSSLKILVLLQVGVKEVIRVQLVQEEESEKLS